MRVLVCGGRDFHERNLAFYYLDCQQPTHIIEGGARGADRIGREYAIKRGIPYTTFPADWDTYKKAAGFIRNQQMLDEGRPDLVMAFEGGRGTADMVRRAKKAGVLVKEI